MTRRTAIAWAVGVLTALVPALALFGFTVDDALIPARYAAHIAAGAGYRFNAEGPATDGVTPLGFPFLLSPFARTGTLAAFRAAKVLGLVAWLMGAGVLGVAIDRAGGSRRRFVGFGFLLLSVPLAAWSVAGLETGFAAALGALAVASRALGWRRLGLTAAALAAALRPELLPWALALAALPISSSAFLRALAVALPFGIIAATRFVVFGSLVPLSVRAKPSDETLGLVYVAACLLLIGASAIVGRRAFGKEDALPRELAIAFGVHSVAVAVAGGDWMPLSRLFVPVLPSVALLAAHVAEASNGAWSLVRGSVAAAGMIFQAVKAGPSAASVGDERMGLIQELAPVLRDARVVAALDIGWVGAATEATVVDLAGLTDPAIASLRGGHTTKAIPRGLLEARNVDTLVLLLLEDRPLAARWSESYFARGVELRVSELPGVEETFAVVATSERAHLRYVVLRRRVGKP